MEWEKNEGRKDGREETEARDDKETNSWVVRSSSGTRSSRERAVRKVTSILAVREGRGCRALCESLFHSYS